ncbi:cytochrome P450 [Nocardia sp. NBC_01730]|nr:cytochrome P450 [Nocardia sp. NBC_01730]
MPTRPICHAKNLTGLTTVSLIVNAVANLCTHPDQLALVRRGVVGWDAVVEETLRYSAPNSNFLIRFATEDVPVGDMVIRSGEALIVSYGAIGRDELNPPGESGDKPGGFSAAPGREPVPVSESVDVTDIGQEPRRAGRSDAVEVGQRRAAFGDELAQFFVRSLGLSVDGFEFADQLDHQAAPDLTCRITGFDGGDQLACLHRGQELLRPTGQ